MDTPGIECSVKNQDVLFDMLTTWADRPCECMLKPLGVRACVCACVGGCVRACMRLCVCVRPVFGERIEPSRIEHTTSLSRE